MRAWAPSEPCGTTLTSWTRSSPTLTANGRSPGGTSPSNRALLDTDISSEILKAVDQTITRNTIAYRKFHGILTVSAVTAMEIVRGFQRNQSHRKRPNFLAAVALEDVLAFDRPDGELAGRIAGHLERTGHPIGLADPMIAANPG
jgi:tRNA(fMet)-specific endonuclease VapC